MTNTPNITPGNDIIAHASGMHYGGRAAVFASAVAVLFSAFSLWETSLKKPDIKVFVPPVLHYASPYQNSNFEMFAVPITMTNEGARTGTILSIELSVHDIKTGETKRFYAADFGRWLMERTRSNAYEPFAPISLAGRSSRTESVLFYTRGEEEPVQQIVKTEPGSYIFTLKLDSAEPQDFGWLDRLWAPRDIEVTFERVLRYYDARAFIEGTLPMYSKTWRTETSDAAGSEKVAAQ